MNKAIEIGRLTRDPEVRYSQGSKGSSEVQGAGQMSTPNGDGFMSVPDDDTGLPFN